MDILARMRLVAVVAVLMTLGATGCGGDEQPREDPGAFVKTLVRTVYRHQAGAAWETLHPLHRETVTRARYVECERKAPLEGEVRSIAVVSVQDVQATVPGQDEQVPSKAVEVRYLLKLPGIAEPQPVTHTAHVFAVEGHWAWVIGPGDYASYAAGSCPAG